LPAESSARKDELQIRKKDQLVKDAKNRLSMRTAFFTGRFAAFFTDWARGAGKADILF
jgi:hypothetical protein